jgi:anti-sigma factor RsiW
MTLHEEWTDKLSDYLDDELTADERSAVDAHLKDCRECVAVLNDLKRVVAHAQAASADVRPPQADLWPGVAGRIEKVRQPQRFTFTLAQLAAAAALVAAVSGGIVWQVVDRSAKASRSGNGDTVAATTEREASAERTQPVEREASAERPDARVEQVGLADAQYDAAVTDLEKALQKGRGKLDASTIAIVEHNLETIDQAIRQAREALVADPANSYLSGHLVEARRRKLELLRRATDLASETN